MMPMDRSKYPPDWEAISRRIRFERAESRCEKCGVKNGALGGRHNGEFWEAQPIGEKRLQLEWPRPGEEAWCIRGGHARRLRIIRIVLTVAHLDHDTTNNADENLMAMCQRCHLAYDAKFHAENARQTRRKKMAIGDLFNA